jgi:hypothetical protein
MTPRTYNLFTVFVVFKRRKKRKSEVRTRRRQRRSILENGWGFVHHRRLEKEGEKKESLPSESSSNGPVANGTSRRKTRNTHLASRFMRLHSHPSFAPIAFSFLSLFLTIITIVKTNAEENDATRNEKRHRISPKTNNKQRV